MKKITTFKKVLAVLLSVAMVVTGLTITNLKDAAADEIIQTLTSPYTQQSNSVLGIAGDFHVFAEGTASPTVHTNGNIATGNLVIQNNFGTNQAKNEFTYARNYVSGSQTIKGTLILGQNNVVTLMNNTEVYINGNKADAMSTGRVFYEPDDKFFIDFVEEYAYLRGLSSALAGMEATDVEAKTTESGDIEYIELKDGVNVLNLTGDQMNALQKLKFTSVNGTKVDFDGTTYDRVSPDQALIINIDLAGKTDFTLGTTSWYVFDNGVEVKNAESTYYNGTNILYNFYDSSKADKQYTGVLRNSSDILGAVLAPSATIYAHAINGNIIGENVTTSNGETHRCDFLGNFNVPVKKIYSNLKAVTLNKIDKNRKSLNGAEFKIYTIDGAANYKPAKAIVNGNATDTIKVDGTTVFSVQPGTYYLQETKAPRGCELDTTLIPIKVDENGNVTDTFTVQIPEVTFTQKDYDLDLKANATIQRDGTVKITLPKSSFEDSFASFTGIKFDVDTTYDRYFGPNGKEYAFDYVHYTLTDDDNVVYRNAGKGQDNDFLYSNDAKWVRTNNFWGVISNTYNQKYYYVDFKPLDAPLSMSVYGTKTLTLKLVEDNGTPVKVTKINSINISGTRSTMTVENVDYASEDNAFVDGNQVFVINNNNAPKTTGDIVITKTIKGDVTEEEADGALEFKVTKEDGTEVGTYTLADFQYDSEKKIYTKTLPALEAGNYVVKETIKDIDGKVLVSVTNTVDGKSSGEGKNVDTANISLKADQTVTVAYEDTYEAKKGNLVITKTIEGPVTKEEAEGALQFKVTTTDGTEVGTYTLKNDFTYNEQTKTWSLTLPQLNAGGYVVEETITDITGKVLVSVTNKVNGQDGGNEVAKATVEHAKTTTVAYKDEYKDETGKLVITKTIEGPVTKEEAEGALEFKVTTTDGKEVGTYTLIDDFTYNATTKTWSLELDELKTGSYVVTEAVTSIDGKILKAVESIVNGQNKAGAIANATVSKDLTTTVDYKNTYVKNEGKIVITKTIEGPVTKEEAEGALQFKVTTADGTEVGTYTLENDFTYNAESKTWTLELVAKAGGYIVTETITDVKGYVLAEVTNVVDGTSKDGAKTDKFDVIAEGTVNVNYKDAYTKETEAPTTAAPTTEAPTTTAPTTTEAPTTVAPTTSEAPTTVAPTTTEAPTTVAPTTTEAPTTSAPTTPAETTPAETTPAETTPAETTPAETTPAETTPAETTPAETTPAETTPAETTPAETTPAETTPAETTPAETTPAETTPAETTPAETTPAETTPAETTPEETTPVETTPVETTADEDAADRETTTEETTSVEETTVEETTVEEATTEETTAEETTAEETTATETTPAETTPAETTPEETLPEDEGELVIVVRDEKTGEVVPDAVIRITYPDGTTEEVKTDSAGRVVKKTKVLGDFEITVVKVPDGKTVTVGGSTVVRVLGGSVTRHDVKVDNGNRGQLNTDDNKLPITGKTVWPISVFGTLGLAFLAFGLFDNYKRKKKNER